MWYSCTNVVPNTCPLEQQQLNKMTKKREEGKHRRLIMQERTGHVIKKSFYLFFDASSMIILVNMCFF